MIGDLSRRPRARRGGPRPGWTLLTTLLVLVIVASSALVFTSRVELLKLAVIIALWAAVVAAFVSVIYRRQSDVERARATDLKLVYNLQLDREISARREYELTVESQLRNELAAELRTQAADEVAALRGELAALRNNLEILFGADLGDRPALEHEPTTVHAYSDWARDDEPRLVERGSADRPITRPEAEVSHPAESPIIDVPEVGLSGPMEAAQPAGGLWQSAAGDHDRYSRAHERHPGSRHRYAESGDRHIEGRGSHRRATEDQGSRWPQHPAPQPSARADLPPPQTPGRHRPPSPYPTSSPHQPPPRYPMSAPHQPPPPKQPPPRPTAPPQPTSAPQQPPSWPSEPAASGRWQPAPRDGRWLPPGAPGSNWVSDLSADAPPTENEPEPRPRHSRHTAEPAGHVAEPPRHTAEPARHVAEPPRHTAEPARHAAEPTDPSPTDFSRPADAPAEPRRARHSAEPTGQEIPTATPTSTPTSTPTPTFSTAPGSAPEPVARHRETEPEGRSRRDAATGGQSVADLLARLQTAGTGGRRRRRRDE